MSSRSGPESTLRPAGQRPLRAQALRGCAGAFVDEIGPKRQALQRTAPGGGMRLATHPPMTPSNVGSPEVCSIAGHGGVNEAGGTSKVSRPASSWVDKANPCCSFTADGEARTSSRRATRATTPQDFGFFDGFDLPVRLSATAWRMSALMAVSSTSSPSWMSIARRTFPSRLELKSKPGSAGSMGNPGPFDLQRGLRSPPGRPDVGLAGRRSLTDVRSVRQAARSLRRRRDRLRSTGKCRRRCDAATRRRSSCKRPTRSRCRRRTDRPW